MLDKFTQTDIDDICEDLLHSCKLGGKFPTQVDDIILYLELQVDNTVDLSKVDESFLSRFPNSNIKEILPKIRGILYRDEKAILLNKNQPANRIAFIKLHECGHHILPWQKTVFDFIDDENNLQPDVKDEFEAQANYFASTMLFQGKTFEQEMAKHPLGINTAMKLSKKFGASVHATVRRYVEKSTDVCSLLVLQKDGNTGDRAIYANRDYFESQSFKETFGGVKWPKNFGYKWDFVKDYYFKKKKTTGSITLKTQNGEADFVYDFFDNTFNGFVLFYPISTFN